MNPQLQSFINTYTGKSDVGNTPQNKGKCVGLIEVWIDTLGLPHIWGNAIDLLNNADKSAYTIILNTPTNAPSQGDILILGRPYGRYIDNNNVAQYAGHTGVVLKADVNKVTLFEQNDPFDGICQTKDYTYEDVIGWIHPNTLPATETVEVDPTVQEQLKTQIEATNSCQSQLKTALDQVSEFQLQLKAATDKTNELDNEKTQLVTQYQQVNQQNKNLAALYNSKVEEDDAIAQERSKYKDLTDEYITLFHYLADTAGVSFNSQDIKGTIDAIGNAYILLQASNKQLSQDYINLDQKRQIGGVKILGNKNISQSNNTLQAVSKQNGKGFFSAVWSVLNTQIF